MLAKFVMPIVLSFGTPYTQVTPPNGAGKMFITDAIIGKCTTQTNFRWALSTVPSSFDINNMLIGSDVSLPAPSNYALALPPQNGNAIEVPEGTVLYLNWQALGAPPALNDSCTVFAEGFISAS